MEKQRQSNDTDRQMTSEQSQQPNTEQNFRKQSSITQGANPENPKETVFFIVIWLPRDILQQTNRLNKYQLGRKMALEKKEKENPEWASNRERWEAYRKLDDRLKQQEKRRNSDMFRAYNEVERHNMEKQKIFFPMFEEFKNRGKSPYIKFSYRKGPDRQRRVEIILNKRYALEQLRITRSSLLALPGTFATTFTSDLYPAIKRISQLSLDYDRPTFYSLFIKSIDIISISFDVVYGDKRIYRFRYSPFEFRTNLLLRQTFNSRLTGYNQQISIIPDIQSLKYSINDQQFYYAPRCFMFEDLTESNMAEKIMQRTNYFYMAYSISRGHTTFYSSGLDSDQYCKKCLWYLYFSTTRLKKFIFTWSFKPFKKNRNYSQLPIKENQLPSKQVIYSIPFYFEIRQSKEMTKDDPFYRIRIQFQEQTREMSQACKEQIYYRVNDWYTAFRQMMSAKEMRHVDPERYNQQIRKFREQGRPEYPDKEANELQTLFGNKDRFDRFLVGLLVVVSTIIDRHFFTMNDQKKDRSSDEIKQVSFETPQTTYFNDKNAHIIHFHWIQIQMEHKILPHLTCSHQQQQQHHGHRSGDIRLKCGEWRFVKLNKWKRDWNYKTKKTTMEPKPLQVLSFPDIFRQYVQILLRHFPLRYIYKDIINFFSGICKACYNGWEDNNALDINTRNETIFRPVISVILSLYYHDYLKVFKDRAWQKYFSGTQGAQQKMPEQEKIRKDDKLTDQFTKVVVLKILTRGDIGFMQEDKLIAEVTFRLMEFKSCWLTRVKEGFLIIRIFEDRIDFEKEYQIVETITFGAKSKTVDLQEALIKEKLEKISVDLRFPLVL